MGRSDSEWQEGLKVPKQQPKRRRLWPNEGCGVRLRPNYRNRVWSYDFVTDRTADGRAFWMLAIIEEQTRECLAIDMARKLTSDALPERLSGLFLCRGTPYFFRSDNGPDFTDHRVRDWLQAVEAKTLFIEPGSPWENRYVESFDGKLRDAMLNREVFDALDEANALIERWRRAYKTVRPHSSVGYQLPAAEAIEPCSLASATPQQANRASLYAKPTLTWRLVPFLGQVTAVEFAVTFSDY